MTRGLRQAAVLTTTFMMVVGIGARSSGAQATDPTVTIDRTGTAAGETMLITGSGWTNGASLIVELCGHGGLRGTVDCDVSHQRTAGVGPSGTFSVELTSGAPPAPCPCVVKATDQTSQIAATAAIAVAGVPTVAITDADQGPVRTIEISSLKITGGGRWFELLGAGARRTLEITLVNTGAVAVDSPELSIAWGSGSAPSGFVEPPDVERMAPGDTQTVTVRLDTPAFSIGQRTAVVEIQGLGEPVVARASTTSYPWGLLALGLVALQLVLLRLRNRLRRRVQRRAVEPLAPRQAQEHEVLALAAAEPEEPDHPSTMDVIDLDAQAIVEEPAEPVEVEAIEAIDLSASEQTAEEPAEAATFTLDLDEMAPEAPVIPEHAEVPVASNGALARVEDARVAAERAAQRAEADAEAMLAAARDRLADLEARASARLEEAEARCERDLELLDAVWRRAAALAQASEAAVTLLRKEIEAEHSAAEQALVEAEATRTSLVEEARRELARILESLDREARALAEAAPGNGASAPARAPRTDELDRRLARAVERALASMGPDRSN